MWRWGDNNNPKAMGDFVDIFDHDTVFWKENIQVSSATFEEIKRYWKPGRFGTFLIRLMAEILHQLSFFSLSHYLQGFIPPRWVFAGFQPPTEWIMLFLKINWSTQPAMEFPDSPIPPGSAGVKDRWKNTCQQLSGIGLVRAGRNLGV